jgi:hypothetical protein
MNKHFDLNDYETLTNLPRRSFKQQMKKII